MFEKFTAEKNYDSYPKKIRQKKIPEKNIF